MHAREPLVDVSQVTSLRLDNRATRYAGSRMSLNAAMDTGARVAIPPGSESNGHTAPSISSYTGAERKARRIDLPGRVTQDGHVLRLRDRDALRSSAPGMLRRRRRILCGLPA